MTIEASIAVRVRFAPRLRARSGAAYETLILTPTATVGDVLAEVARLHPELADALPAVLPVVAGAQRAADWPVSNGEEIALLMAVSGG